MIETEKIYELQETVLTFQQREGGGAVSNSTSPILPRKISPEFDNNIKTEDPNLFYFISSLFYIASKYLTKKQ